MSGSERIRCTRELATATCALAICALTIATGAFGQVADPVSRALLIGINDYSSPSVPDLKGAVNDVTMLERILTTRFGFASRNVAVLTDRDATRDGILDALADLARAAGPNDIVYIHFSGHGSQIADLNGDEAEDMLDETILSQDARLEGIPDITDDELERLFSQIGATRTLIVFDSCNSGTVTRGPSIVRPRAVPPDDRVDLYRRLTASTRAVVEVQTLPHVLMTGAPAEQQALDGPINDGWYGLFSYAFAQSLDRLGPDATAVEVHDHVKVELQKIQEQLRLTTPEPQLEGPTAKFEQPLLALARGDADEPGASDEARRAWLEVVPMAGNAVRLRNGLALNARIGSQWAVYDSEEIEFEYGNAIAIGTVEAIDGYDSILAIRHRNADIPPNARAIGLITANPSSSIPVRIDGLAGERRRERRLESAIESRLPAVRFVDEGEFARFIVRLEPGSWHVLDAAGLDTALTIPDADDSVVADRLATVFATSANAASLLALDNPLAEIRISAQLVADANRADASGPRGIEVRAKPAPTVRIRRPGDPRSASNSLMLEVTSDRDVYITIVDIDTEGGINMLFPNSYQNPDFLPNGFVRGNAPVRIPDSLGDGNRAGFSWDYTPPTGKDTIKVIATSDATLANAIRQFVSRIANREDTLETLRSALAGAAVRGVGVVANVPAGAAAPATPAATATLAAPASPAAPAAPAAAETSAAVATSAGANAARQSGRTDWATASIVIEVTE